MFLNEIVRQEIDVSRRNVLCHLSCKNRVDQSLLLAQDTSQPYGLGVEGQGPANALTNSSHAPDGGMRVDGRGRCLDTRVKSLYLLRALVNRVTNRIDSRGRELGRWLLNSMGLA